MLHYAAFTSTKGLASKKSLIVEAFLSMILNVREKLSGAPFNVDSNSPRVAAEEVQGSVFPVPSWVGVGP